MKRSGEGCLFLTFSLLLFIVIVDVTRASQSGLLRIEKGLSKNEVVAQLEAFANGGISTAADVVPGSTNHLREAKKLERLKNKSEDMRKPFFNPISVLRPIFRPFVAALKKKTKTQDPLNKKIGDSKKDENIIKESPKKQFDVVITSTSPSMDQSTKDEAKEQVVQQNIKTHEEAEIEETEIKTSAEEVIRVKPDEPVMETETELQPSSTPLKLNQASHDALFRYLPQERIVTLLQLIEKCDIDSQLVQTVISHLTLSPNFLSILPIITGLDVNDVNALNQFQLVLQLLPIELQNQVNAEIERCKSSEN